MLISSENLCLAYENHTVIRDLSFSVRKGEYLCIIGENGSGKSTLMRALLGLKNVESGKIQFGGGLKQNEIGYLPQQTGMQRDFPASVREVVLSGRLNRIGFRPFYSGKDKKAAEENMRRLNIAELQNCCYRELSGGQQQRVLLARALCATQKLLLLDEPVAGLDLMVTDELYRVIYDLNRNQGITVIMVTHDVDRALRDATHILHLHKDETFFGKKDEYLQCRTCRHFTEEGRQNGKADCCHG